MQPKQYEVGVFGAIYWLQRDATTQHTPQLVVVVRVSRALRNCPSLRQSPEPWAIARAFSGITLPTLTSKRGLLYHPACCPIGAGHTRGHSDDVQDTCQLKPLITHMACE